MHRILQANDISKTFQSGDTNLTVLEGIHFTIMAGESVAIVGPSGSGKTTLLGLSAGLDRPSSGSVYIFDHEISAMDEDQKAAIRNQYVGFVFQNFQLIPTLTALENVMIPLELQGKPREALKRSKELLDRVGLKDRMGHYPSQLSGGEQQRVSLARAFSNTPKLLFADEPTGNLDGHTGAQIESLLFDLNREEGTTLVIVTHDMDLAHKTKRIIKLRSGRIIADDINQVIQ